eukprot:266899_1
MFVIWILLLLYQTFVSKWNSFCYYMIASKHDSFVLLQQIDEFQQQCDIVFKSIIANNLQQLTDEAGGQQFTIDAQKLCALLKKFLFRKQLSQDVETKSSNIKLVAFIVNCFIIMILQILILDANKYCPRTENVILKYNLITLWIVLLLCF